MRLLFAAAVAALCLTFAVGDAQAGPLKRLRDRRACATGSRGVGSVATGNYCGCGSSACRCWAGAPCVAPATCPALTVPAPIAAAPAASCATCPGGSCPAPGRTGLFGRLRR